MNSRAVVGGVQQANQPLSCEKFRGDNPPDLFHSFIKLKINDTLKILVSLQFLKVEFHCFSIVCEGGRNVRLQPLGCNLINCEFFCQEVAGSQLRKH